MILSVVTKKCMHTLTQRDPTAPTPTLFCPIHDVLPYTRSALDHALYSNIRYLLGVTRYNVLLPTGGR